MTTTSAPRATATTTHSQPTARQSQTINFTPLRDLILVLPDPEPDKIGSIVIPAGTLPQGHKPGPSEHCFIGTVVAVGRGDKTRADDSKRHPMLTKPGDRVVYPRRPSAPGGDCDVVIDGVTYLMFHEEQNAYAVVEA